VNFYLSCLVVPMCQVLYPISTRVVNQALACGMGTGAANTKSGRLWQTKDD
jgi:hypothetical protein